MDFVWRTCGGGDNVRLDRAVSLCFSICKKKKKKKKIALVDTTDLDLHYWLPREEIHYYY